ncbi:MAG: DNA-directed RNA polymerase subunit omega [Candidatus Saganbacteria bacterium]|nr:DNA-directed RNA polymerase subunit omega [Candidatus Saganbacteria bacterium]
MTKEQEKKSTPMAVLSIDNLLSKAENKFLLSNAIAGRAKQVSEGSLPYVSDFDPTNPIVTAIKEIANDKIRIKVLKTAPKETPKEEEAEALGEEVSVLEELSRKKNKKYK